MLMQSHQLGRPAVRQALSILRAEGLITTNRGRPSYVRPKAERRDLPIASDDRGIVRMPIDQERKELGIDIGVPIIEVTYADGHTETHAADRVVIRGKAPAE
jgi:GntR family transcriptional regulator